MLWTISFNRKGIAGLRSVTRLQQAVNDACELLDNGAHVQGISGDGGLVGMDAAEVLAIHAKRNAKKSI